WISDYSGIEELYYRKYDYLFEAWSAIARVSNNSNEIFQKQDFIVDNNDNLHFVWSQGEENSQKILFRTIWNNETKGVIEEVTYGINKAIDPAIIIDENNRLNIFWSNHTSEIPTDVYGTKFINTASKSIYSSIWSNYLEVAPFIPQERPPSSRSDASNPAITLDKAGYLWLAYEIQEDYAYHKGIDIRYRTSSGWQISEKISLINNLAKNPQLLVDNDNFMYAFWLDSRSANYQLFYRVRNDNYNWYNEIQITTSPSHSRSNWIFIGAFIGGVILLMIPYVIYKYLRRRRERNLIKNKISFLKEG
ncbi:MAG: hypothetical protein U9O98_06465, partial [Asgard group archaeon]|nr:hypothetical protein [Asgard group archaeon]